jgi:hypothetical protein
MSKTMDDRWADVEAALQDARGIAFDTCHKIYILMDEAQVQQMELYGYDPLITKDRMGSAEMLTMLRAWYDTSCGLRFINSVRTVSGNPNDGYDALIPQFADHDDDWEDCEDGDIDD